jgi:hypothetical protein
MTKIDIDSTEFQEFSVLFEGDLISITLNFRFDNWLMDLSYNDKELKGVRLSSGVTMLEGKNFPFEIVIYDKGLGLDPFSADCFERNLFEFLVLDRDEVFDIRGYEVE